MLLLEGKRMLLTFRVRNHRSLRDLQEFSMIASGQDSKDSRLISSPALEEKVGRCAAIYGANASGKSSVLYAMALARATVLFSQRAWSPDDGLPITPFGLGPELVEGDPEPSSEFEFNIVVGGIRYRYGFELTATEVTTESLHAWPNGKKQLWFERNGGEIRFGRHLSGDNSAIHRLTRPNSLFLSAAAQNNHRALMPVFEWFTRMRFRFHGPMMARLAPSADIAVDEPRAKSLVDNREAIVALLRSADVGILDMKAQEIGRADDTFPNAGRRHFKVEFLHEGERPSWLGFRDESGGTATMFELTMALPEVLQSGGLFVVDELERSMHPALALEIVKTIQSPRLNPNNAQLVFATHDTHLLGPMADATIPLRRDQVWFTEKDSTGATRLFPLSDVQTRKGENLERGYLAGRYGGLGMPGPLKAVR